MAKLENAKFRKTINLENPTGTRCLHNLYQVRDTNLGGMLVEALVCT